jgi:Uma2 family endonuclease
LTPAEYLARERQAPFKSEYFEGESYAMAGASRRHNRITLNTGAQLTARLKASGCEPFVSDMRVKVAATGLYTYPDVCVACPPEFEDAGGDTLLNPAVIFEVLSDSTEAYDRGRKFEHYRKLPSLREYLLVAQHAPQIDHYVRGEAGVWLLREAAGLEARLTLETLDCELPLSEIYARVEFEAAPAAPPGEPRQG